MNNCADDDEDVKREREAFPERTVAVVIIVDPNHRIVLVRTRRLPRHWQPPGGGVKDFDKTPFAAALREVNEELGLTLNPSQIRHVYEAPYDFGHGVVHFFVAPAPCGGIIVANDLELAEWRWVNIQTALELPMFPATHECIQFLASNEHLLKEVANQGC